jgi:hypothetical protein
MQPSDSAGQAREPASGAARHPRLRRLVAGGTDGNEQLTALTGVVLLALLAALGVTIVRIGALLDVHMFLGMALIGPIALKIASTGYRFVRYYTGSRSYRRKGPPAIELRALAPLVVLSTLAVFATGVALLITGPSGRGFLTELHKITFIVWVAVTALHVIGHLAELPSALVADRRQRAWDDHGSGRGSRAVLLASAIAGGLILAIVTDSQFAAWTHFRHHHG